MDPPYEDDDSNTPPLFHYSSDSCAVSRLHFSEESWRWVKWCSNICYMEQKRGKGKLGWCTKKRAHCVETVKTVEKQDYTFNSAIIQWVGVGVGREKTINMHACSGWVSHVCPSIHHRNHHAMLEKHRNICGPHFSCRPHAHSTCRCACNMKTHTWSISICLSVFLTVSSCFMNLSVFCIQPVHHLFPSRLLRVFDLKPDKHFKNTNTFELVWKIHPRISYSHWETWPHLLLTLL